MRRKISLYIDGRLADLDDQSFILLNYSMEDLSNPTIVKNSFSQQITLKGTPANNEIFGDFYRLDRTVDFNSGNSGPGFNPSKKTPFAIYNELDEILESGYCKLDEVVKTRQDISYKISLYGGLGAFLYSLSYDEAGNKRTLADLDYLGNADSAELDFIINATAISDAWGVLTDMYYHIGTPTGKWTVINFAPAYNGIPDNFSADKAIYTLGAGSYLPNTYGGYSGKSGYGLINLASPQDEWAVKDLRSYLQRPVLSMKAFWQAIANPDNNGGYTVDISDITGNPFYDIWLTLPTIPSLGTMKQDTGDLALTLSSSASTGNEIGRYNISGTVPYGATVNASIRCKVRYNMPSGADSYATLSLSGSSGSSARASILFLQMVAYASDNTVVGGSPVKVVTSLAEYKRSPMAAANACGFTPPYSTDAYEGIDSNATRISSGLFELTKELAFNIEAQNVAYYKLRAYAYTGTGALQQGNWVYSFDQTGGGNGRLTLYASLSTYYQANSSYIINGSGNIITKTDPTSLRSGARVTKSMLLSTSGTPADYLLSLCKMFGFYFLVDTSNHQVTIVDRNTLYVNDTVDLTEMVDLSRGITVQPLLFDSKWYRFSLEGIGGAFFNEYKDIEGVDYGIQLIDTGFDFNADVKDLLDTSVFKNACAILQRSRYWNIIETGGGIFVPSPFLDKGNTVTRWDADDNTQDTPISCPPSTATVTYYNTEVNGYDKKNMSKVEFADADGKMVDGKDVLLFLKGFARYDSFKVTDDLPIMSVVNNGQPCWILDEGAGVVAPIFSRYNFVDDDGDDLMTASLDFGAPRQLDIPAIVYNQQATIYAKAWRDYLSDRYDVNTRVMRCFVHFKGLQVNHGLLRIFYYYDNALWVLNRIINYSMTTYDPVECEFIKVKNKNNYLTGQDY